MDMSFFKNEKLKKIVVLCVFVGICELVGIIGAVFTTPSIPTWYATLVKPALQPPSWIFGPVWTILYFLMGVAAFLIWERRNTQKGVGVPLVLFGIQLTLNFVWSFLFFNAHALGLAVAEIAFLWLSIAACIVTFAKISKPAAALLIPYILWVSFASYLNYAIYRLN